MKNGMKKMAAAVLALMMTAGMVPAMGDTYSSSVIAGYGDGYRDPLEILSKNGTMVLVNQTLDLEANETYVPEWASDNEAVAAVDDVGRVTAVSEGTAMITATEDGQRASIMITVIDPEPMTRAAETAEEQPEDGNTEEEVPDGAAEQPETERPVSEKPAEKISIVIVINGGDVRTVFDGQMHEMSAYTAAGSREEFDASRIRTTRDISVAAENCGTYEMKLDPSDFLYDDPDVNAVFAVNNGWLRITPAKVVVKADNQEKESGEPDPELTVTVTGLLDGDSVEYEVSRVPGETAGEYRIDVNGTEKQGNYRVQYEEGTLLIRGAPTVAIEDSLQPGQKVYAGTERTLKAVVSGFETDRLAYQWQWSMDGENWNNIEDAVKRTYTYRISRENANNSYRVLVTPMGE